MIQLQLALDLISEHEAFALVEKVHNHIDIIEIGIIRPGGKVLQDRLLFFRCGCLEILFFKNDVVSLVHGIFLLEGFVHVITVSVRQGLAFSALLRWCPMSPLRIRVFG